MRIPLTDQQREHLRGVRKTQLADWHAHPFVVDEIFVKEEVVRLMSGMGRACYLGLDGRIWVGNLGEGELPSVLSDPKGIASCIVRWSGCIGLPELVNALPPMATDGIICPLCHSSRETHNWVNDRDDGFRYYCMRCGGLGWIIPAEQDAAAELPRE
jgi:hypothetical protein